MGRDLGLSASGQQWVVNAYVLAMASLVALGGKIGDKLGDKLGGVTTFRIGVAALVMVHVAKPVNTKQAGITVQTRSVVAVVFGIATTILAVQQASTWGSTASATLVALAAGIGVTAWFVVSQVRSSNPLVNVRLFARKAFLGNLVVLGFVQFGMLAAILYSSIYLQDLLGMSPMMAGLGVLPLILALAAAAQLGGRWYDHSGVRPPVLTGLTVSVIGLAAWTISLPTLGYAAQVPGMVLSGFGIGLLMSPTNTDALGRVSFAERSQAAGLVQTVRQLGGTLGVAVIGAVVLGLEHGTGHSTSQQIADAITVGFACAAAAFAAALIAGWILLSRERIAEKPSTKLAVRAPERSPAGILQEVH